MGEARQQGIADIADIRYGVLEPDGRFSFVRFDGRAGTGRGGPAGCSLDPVDVELFRDEGLGNGSYLVEIGEAARRSSTRTAGTGGTSGPPKARGSRSRPSSTPPATQTSSPARWSLRAADRRRAARAGGGRCRSASPGRSRWRIDLDDVEVEVFATPGHAPEHVSYVFRREGDDAPVLFSGGALIVGGAARRTWRGRSSRSA